MNNELKNEIANELERVIGKAIRKKLNPGDFGDIAIKIAEQRMKYEQTTDEDEKKKISNNVKLLESQIKLKVETHILKLAKKGENALNKAIKAVLKKYLPFI